MVGEGVGRPHHSITVLNITRFVSNALLRWQKNSIAAYMRLSLAINYDPQDSKGK